MDSLIFLLIFSLLHLCLLLDISCNYEDDSLMLKLDSVYCCVVQKNLSITLPQKNSKIIPNGNHENGKFDKSVDCISSLKNDFQYLPEGLDKSFGELKAIWIRSGNIKMISQNDLKPFTELVNLDLSYNDIKTLENRLFDYNINLEVFFCSSNKIFFIAPTAFDKPNKLSNLNLGSNNCTNINVIDNIEEVKTAIKDLKEKCYTLTSPIYKSNETLRNEREIYKAKLDKILQKNQDETTRHRIEVLNISKDNRIFQNEVKILTEKFENITKSCKPEDINKNDYTEKYRSTMMMIFVIFNGIIQTIIMIFIYKKFLS
ncbi:hypothetical protein ACKWTF_014059 [Chironomus riparius]